MAKQTQERGSQLAQLPGLPHDRALRERARTLFISGQTSAAIGEELALSAGTIRSWSKRDDWRVQKNLSESNPELTPNELAEAAENDGEIIQFPDDLGGRQAQYQDDLQITSLKLSRKLRGMATDELLARANKVKDLDGVARKALKIEQDKPQCLIQLNVLASPQNRIQRSQ